MLNRLRQHASDEGGFTLIELLVVILIIGILAAIAIPAFLSQTSKAYDSSAKTLAQTAQTAAATYDTESSNGYAGMTVAELKAIEPSLVISSTEGAAKGEPYVVIDGTPSATGYELTAVAAHTGDKFSIKVASGVTTRPCENATGSSGGTSGCKITSGNVGEW